MTLKGNMFITLFLLANVGFIGAITPRVSVSKTSLTINKGSKDVIAFTLDEPIICPTLQNNCSVTMLLTNPNNKKIALDNCKIKWNWDEWFETRYLTVSAVENFINDVPFEGFIKTEPIISNSEYYSNFNAVDIFVKTVTRPSATCSGTGDPHYTTFDGAYWHVYYSGNYILYKSLLRDFEVQVAARGYPAQHCGFAAKEGNDIVVVYACNGNLQQRRSCGTSTCKDGSFPKVKVSGRSFRVEFQSGALVRLDYYNNVYGNMYVTAPGLDYKNTVGICGNFNGIASDDIPIYRATSQSQMPSSYIPKIDLFNWQPSSTYNVDKSPYVEECKYVDPVVILPILNNPDAEDITKLIKDIVTPIKKNDTFVIDTPVIKVKEEDMFKLCDTVIRNAKSAQTCENIIPNFDLEQYIKGCVEDMMFSNGDIQFIELTLEGLEEDCKSTASSDQNTWEKDNNGNPIEPNIQIQQNLCPSNCNGNGICQMAKCICNDNFKGSDCSIDTSRPPLITKLNEYNFDSRNIKNTPSEIHVYGENFWNSPNLRCKFGIIETEAFYMGSSQILCSVPKVSQKGSDEVTLPISVTTDGINWAIPTQKFTYYDSVCEVCVNNDCNINKDSCTIDGICRLNTEHLIDNVCLICNPLSSVSNWTYSYKSQVDCGPIVSKEILSVRIVESNKKGNIFYKIDAQNPLTKGDTFNKLTYKLINSNPIFAISPNGEFYTTDDLIVNTLIKPFNNLITFQVSDSALNTVTGQIVIDLIKTNESPLFTSEFYIFNISENIPLNTNIGNVMASDKDTGSWGIITYSMFLINGIDNFEINSSYGSIKNTRNIDFETQNKYTYIVTARDGGGQFHMTNLQINVINENEPPYDIFLSSNKVNENMPIGTIVGILNSKDYEDTVFRYEISSMDFKIKNNMLITNKVFDYETDPKSIEIKIRSYDPLNLYMDKIFTIYIININEAPINIKLSITNISESSKVNSVVSEVLLTDPENDIVYCQIVNKSPFIISNNRIILNEKLDYETFKSYILNISCIDSGTPPQINSISNIMNIINENEGAQNVDFNMIQLPENIPINTVVGKVSAKNYDLDAKYIHFTTDENFQIQNTKCVSIQNGIYCDADIILKKELDYESSVRIITITTETDKNISSLHVFPLVILDINENPIGLKWKDDLNQIMEYSSNGTIVGYLSVIDEDLNEDYNLYTEDNTFQIRKVDSNEFEVTVKNSDFIRYDLSDKIQFDVVISDSVNKVILPIIVNVLDAPVKIYINKIYNTVLKLKENITVGTVVGNLIFINVDSTQSIPELISESEYFDLEDKKLILKKNLDYEIEPKFEFRINNIPFVVLVENINEPPEILSIGSINIDIDTNVGTTLQINPNLKAVDPEGDKIIFSIPSDNNNNEHNIFRIDPDTGILRIQTTPSNTNVKLGFYRLRIGMYDGLNYVEGIIKYQITNGCTQNPCGLGRCTPKFQSYECTCLNKKSGLNCNETITQIEASTSNSDSIEKSAIIGVVMGTVLLLIIIIALVIIINRNHRNDTNKVNPKLSSNQMYDSNGVFNPLFVNSNVLSSGVSFTNPMYNNTNDNQTQYYADIQNISNSINLTNGLISNPIYDWYKPDLDRIEAESYLSDKNVGEFVVRESKATPGWHIFSIKKTTTVVHEKIRFTNDGMYEMVVDNRKEPKFPDIPSLVEYYAYDSSKLYDNPNITNIEVDIDGVYNPMYDINISGKPALPIKEKYLNNNNSVI